MSTRISCNPISHLAPPSLHVPYQLHPIQQFTFYAKTYLKKTH